MSDLKPLLIEIGCEELPPKALDELSQAFARILVDEFNVRYVTTRGGDPQIYASPRRLAVYFPAVIIKQLDVQGMQTGPSVSVGTDSEGKPTAALIGFAKKIGVDVQQLEKDGEGKSAKFVYRSVNPGQSTAALLPEIISRSLKRLPVPKLMRWGDHDYAFVRPMHWLVILHGDQVVDAEIFGIKSGRESRGHRFHHPQPVTIGSASDYVDALRAAKVLADPAERRERVRAQVERAAHDIGGNPRLRDELLDEIANLTEWPVAIACQFEAEFLQVPQEALIQTMETNQKFVPVFDVQGSTSVAGATDANGKLSEHFIGVANIESTDPAEIRKGYERVIRPRFADAKFFYDEDLKTPLVSLQEALKSVTYQQQLGSVWDKCIRVAELARVIANRLGVDAALATRAAALSKCDLMTRMVGEFPELQGVMGRYYAAAQGENPDVAQALDEFYKPRFAGDDVAKGKIAQVLAVAERLDTLAGIFAVGMKPSGNKDPFALKRAALGLARTLIENGMELDLEALLREAVELLPAVHAPQRAPKPGALAQPAISPSDEKYTLVKDLQDFVFDRLRGYYAERGRGSDQFDAVRAVETDALTDFDRRLSAVHEFAGLADAQALAAANKRIGNILRQAGETGVARVELHLLDAGAEAELHHAVETAAAAIAPLVAQGRYIETLRLLANLRAPIDRYFDEVMVMVDDQAKRQNRLALLQQLRRMFLYVADISLLQSQ